MPGQIKWKLLLGSFIPFPFCVGPARPILHQELSADISHQLRGADGGA
jgi:hypothetical protein